MNLAEYFDNTKGFGVLATADSKGRVHVAVHSRPYMINEDHLFFIMRDRLPRNNLKFNGYAAFLFVEERFSGYRGVRLLLRRTGEDEGVEEQAKAVGKEKSVSEKDKDSRPLYLVFFRIIKALPLLDFRD